MRFRSVGHGRKNWERLELGEKTKSSRWTGVRDFVIRGIERDPPDLQTSRHKQSRGESRFLTPSRDHRNFVTIAGLYGVYWRAPTFFHFGDLHEQPLSTSLHPE
jgi:hypothetical protein